MSLDLTAREVTIDGRATALSDREFRLLRYLIEHAGQVVSRESILSAVWGYYFDPRSNVVDVCVRRLRRKLGADVSIETVRHAGYRVTAA
jgi:DNA-binding response OmpR family regulator